MNARFSAVVVGGGGLLAHPHEPLEDLQWTRSVAIPVVFLGVGANGDCTRGSSELLDGSLAISGRDDLSLEALACGTARERFLLRDPVLCASDAAALLEFAPPLTVSPDTADYYRMQASVLERLHRFDDALRAASRASKLRPGDDRLATDVQRISSAYVNAMRH
jgi:hypothetical protein